MPRPEKVAVVEEIRARFENSGGVILTEYRGLRVAEMQQLRRALREAGTELKIVKNTLARRAVEGLSYSEIVQFFEGPVAIAFYGDDPVPAAKLLRSFSAENPALVIKGGLLAGEVIDAAATRSLADLESREVLLAKIAGALQAPMTKLAGASSALLRNFAYALGSYLSVREAEARATGTSEGDEQEHEPEGEVTVLDTDQSANTESTTEKEIANGQADD